MSVCAQRAPPRRGAGPHDIAQISKSPSCAPPPVGVLSSTQHSCGAAPLGTARPRHRRDQLRCTGHRIAGVSRSQSRRPASEASWRSLVGAIEPRAFAGGGCGSMGRAQPCQPSPKLGAARNPRITASTPRRPAAPKLLGEEQPGLHQPKRRMRLELRRRWAARGAGPRSAASTHPGGDPCSQPQHVSTRNIRNVTMASTDPPRRLDS
jgi:hypothetical protein